MALPAKNGVATPMVMILEDGVTTQYPQVSIYAAGGTTPLITTDLLHKDEGRYEANWTPGAVGTYSAHYIVYSNAGHTTENTAYTRELEQVTVTDNTLDDLGTLTLRLLGINHENAFMDNTVYDAATQMTSARLRTFDSKTNADAATDGGSETTGLVATYTITAVYGTTVGDLATYKMTKV